MEYNIGDIVKTKKPHPCGNKEWEITRVGVDFKLKCTKCEHIVILPREKALKSITKLITKKANRRKLKNVNCSQIIAKILIKSEEIFNKSV